MSSDSDLPLGALDLHDEHILLPPSAKVSEAAKALLENPDHSILIYEGVSKKGMFSFIGGKKQKVLGILSIETLMHSLDNEKRISGKHSITKAMKKTLLEYHVGTPLKVVVDEISQRQPYGVIARADDGTFVGFMSMSDFQEARALVNGRVPPSETRIIRHGPNAVLSDLLKPDPSTGMVTSKPLVLHPHETFARLIHTLVVNPKAQAVISNMPKKTAESATSLSMNQLKGTANVRTVLKILASGLAPKTIKLNEQKHLDSAWLNMSEESLFSRVRDSSSNSGWNSLLVTDSRDRILAAFSKAEFSRHETGGASSTGGGGGLSLPTKKAKAPFVPGEESSTSEIDDIVRTIEGMSGTRPVEVEVDGEDEQSGLELDEDEIADLMDSTSQNIEAASTTSLVSIPIRIEDPEIEEDLINDADIKPMEFDMNDPLYDPEGNSDHPAPKAVPEGMPHGMQDVAAPPPPPMDMAAPSSQMGMDTTPPPPPMEMDMAPPPMDMAAPSSHMGMDTAPPPPPMEMDMAPPPPPPAPMDSTDVMNQNMMDETQDAPRGRYQ